VPSETELAFLENLILQAGIPGPRLVYLINLRQAETKEVWKLSADLQVAGKEALNEAYVTAVEACEAAGPQGFSFSEGAMIGPWELVRFKGRSVGGECWVGRRDGREGLVRLVPPGTGQDPARTERFVERSNPGLEPPHPSILRIDEADEDFGWLYTATFGFDGDPLAALLSGGPLAEGSAVAFMQSLTGSLRVVHELGVVHGALNPLAVLVKDARTHLSDFGVSSALLDGPPWGCRPGSRLGALLYASPELIAGDGARGLDQRDDLYALGALASAALCPATPGARPAGPDAPWLAEPPVSPNLRTVLARLLAPREDARYATADALMADLGRVAQGQAPAPLPPVTPPVTGRRAATAAPQVALTAEVLTTRSLPAAAPTPAAPRDPLADTASSIEPAAPPPGALDDEEPDDDDAEVERTASGRRKVPAARRSSRRLTAGKRSSGSGEVAKAPKRPVSSRRSRLGSPPGAAKPKGAGWGALLASLVLVGGGLAGAVVMTQPQGATRTRTELAEAMELAGGEAPDYAAALAKADAALERAAADPELAREALRVRRTVVRRALAERSEALAGPEAERADALQGLQARAAGTVVAELARYDVACLQSETPALVWTQLGDALLEAGRADVAADAYRRADRPELPLAVRASRMAVVPGGWYLAPAEDGEGEEAGEGGLALVRRPTVYLGRTEVSRGEYRAFLAALEELDEPHAGCSAREPDGEEHAPAEAWPRGGDLLPATGLDYWDAVAYAKWAGAALPDLATLTAAARGPLGRRFPWGDGEPDPALASYGGRLGPVPVGSFPPGASEGGALDLIGNAEEWIEPAGLEPSTAPLFGGHHGTPAGELAAGVTTEAAPLDEAKPERGVRLMLVLPEE